MAELEEEKGRKGKVVCVTGGGGYVGSWLVKLLLDRNYFVHATLRDPQNAHLRKLERASENLQLFKVNLLDYDSLSLAINGCDSVFHVASPVPFTPTVPNPEVELMEPAVKGTLNVLKTSSEANIKRVVFVSSVAAVMVNPSWPNGQLMDETCWSDKDYCRNTNWYCLSKTEAESEAWEFAKTSGLDLVTVCPSFVFGPMLQSTPNYSSLIIIKLLKEGYEESENRSYNYVDVRDLAEALILVNENPEAKGRYICTTNPTKVQDLGEILKRTYPKYNYPKKYSEIEASATVSSEKLQKLGWCYRSLEETLIDSVESYKLHGIID